jgi:hypothetical protein
MTMVGYTKITKKQFYALGGFSNPALVRKQAGKVWAYYQKAYRV